MYPPTETSSPQLNNPFDLLPPKLFNLLGSQGGLQRHYVAILLRLYGLAEFNRFGLTREIVIQEITAYLAGEEAQSLADAALSDPDAPDDTLSPGDVQNQAGWFLRRLVSAGWLEREQQADYSERIILPDYAFTLLEALRTIQQQKPQEYTGQLYAAHQLLTHRGKDFSPALALTQAYENVRQVIRGLNELNHNIRRYTERVTRNKSVPELLRLQFEEYAQTLLPTYHTLKTSDHVSRYRRNIVTRLRKWQLNADWLATAADELATQTRLSPAQAADEISHYLRFIIDKLETLDPLLAEIDQRHAQYLRTSLKQIKYRLVSADGSFQDKLAAIAKHLSAMQQEKERWLPEELPAFQVMPIHLPDANSFYTPPRRRAPFAPQPVTAPVLDAARMRSLQEKTLREMSHAITPAKIQHFVDGFLNGSSSVHIRDIPADAFARPQDLPWLIYTIAYANHPETRYTLEPESGTPVDLGLVRVAPFQLARRK